MINPVDAFITAEDFKELEIALIDLMKRHADGESQSPLKGHDIEHIIRKIMFDNAFEFALRNYK